MASERIHESGPHAAPTRALFTRRLLALAVVACASLAMAAAVGCAPAASDNSANGNASRDYYSSNDAANAGNFGAGSDGNYGPYANTTSTNAAGTNNGTAANNEGGVIEPPSNERYGQLVENPFMLVTRDPVSTFSSDVDSAAYANVRRFLNDDQLPPKDAVRIEELINYFNYDYPQPEAGEPFRVVGEVNSCPWNAEHRLVHIGLQGRTIAMQDMPPRNLVFLIDVSGSMEEPSKLPLVVRGLEMLVDSLTERDRIAIVVYAGSSGLVLDSTNGSRKDVIRGALRRLSAGGSTNGGAGIQLAYDTAVKHVVPGGANRVILCTDGDFNVGTTGHGDLVRMIEDKRKTGVYLTVLGFGRGNINDHMLEQVANNGNGFYAYVDSVDEARKVFVTEAAATLVTIAQDVKIQVEFNPAEVQAYRLIGYENRLLREQDFRDDTKDAGDIGAGHSVTALYEVIPVGIDNEFTRAISNPQNLRYQGDRDTTPAAVVGELMTLRLAYKRPGEANSKELAFAVMNNTLPLEQATEDFRFSAAVAMFGLLLRQSEYRKDASWQTVTDLAEGARSRDQRAYRAEFLTLAAKAARLDKTGSSG